MNQINTRGTMNFSQTKHGCFSMGHALLSFSKKQMEGSQHKERKEIWNCLQSERGDFIKWFTIFTVYKLFEVISECICFHQHGKWYFYKGCPQ